jgi:hypothetical protein
MSNINKHKPFLLHWEQDDQPKTQFASNKQMPFSQRERGRIADNMTVQQVTIIRVI